MPSSGLTLTVIAMAALILALVSSVEAGHECIHDKLPNKPNPFDPANRARQDYPIERSVHIKNNKTARFHQLATFEPLRIVMKFFEGGTTKCTTVGESVPTYSGANPVTCTADDILTLSKEDYVKNSLMRGAAAFLGDALNVQRATGNLILSRSKCGSTPGIDIATADQTTGVADADFVVYVSAVPLADAGASTIAWALGCVFDQDGRPIAGHVNFVPKALTNAAVRNGVQLDEDISTAVHELCHALGFNSQFFNSGYLALDGTTQVVGGLETRTHPGYGKSMSVLVFPRVVREAQTHFGCGTLTGVEIEDHGGSGTAGSHWEKRLFFTEFMCGISSSVKSFYSRMTLAFFEDLGLYTANYAAASTGMTWGKSQGCDFINKKCNELTGTEFCFEEVTGVCTHDRLGRGYCGIATYNENLPAEFQYFAGSPTKGGAVYHSDYCPAVLAYDNTVCINSAQTDTQDIYGNTYSSSSRCFASNLIESGYQGSTSNARCFTYSCSSQGVLLINVKGQTVWCPTDRSAGNADLNGLIGYGGYIACPAADVFCADPSAPTPVPTPQPPTPEPTPAPPGFTPEPPAVTRPAPTPQATLPLSCVDRAACAANLMALMPACRLLAKELVDCFGTNCDGELVAWLDANGFVAKCDNRAALAEECQESYTGAADLCMLAGASSPFAVSVVSAAAVLVVFSVLFG